MFKRRIAASALVAALAVAGCGGGEGDGGGGDGAEDLVTAVETCFNEAKLPDVRVTKELKPEILSGGAEAAVLSHAPEEYAADQVIVFDTAENAKAYSDGQAAADTAENRGALKGLANFASFGRSSVLTYGEGARQDKIIACARENP
jgi:hypothetical protein